MRHLFAVEKTNLEKDFQEKLEKFTGARLNVTCKISLSNKAYQSQIMMTNWYMQKMFGEFSNKEDIQPIVESREYKREAVDAFEIFKQLGEAAVQIQEKFDALEPFELETMGSLRDEGASIPDLIDYLRAERGFNADGNPVRHEMATVIRKKQFKENTKKIEARSGAVFAIAAGIGILGIGTWVAMSGDFTAIGALPKVIGEPLLWALESVGTLFKNLVLGGALIAGWKGYKMVSEIRSGRPALDLGKDQDFSDLGGPVSTPDYKELNVQIQSIPSADQHLIKHLSPLELRFFLMGGDSGRLHLLRTNPPPQRALIEAAVENMGRAQQNWKNSVKVAWLMLSAPLLRDRSETGIPRLRERMNTWRRNAEVNRASETPTVRAPKSSADCSGR